MSTETTRVEIRNRWTQEVQFACDLETIAGESERTRRGRAVREAVEGSADLRGSDLRGSDLSGSDLRGSNLSGSDLRGSNLSGSNLSGSDLRGSDLRGSDLRGSDLRGSDLSGSDLSGSDLSGSDLRDSDLRGSDLSGSNLSGSDLRGSNLSGSKNADLVIAKTRILPEGDLIGWKKCQDGVIVKLRIPAEAKRSHAFGRKCRAEYADVLEVIGAEVGVSSHDGETEYRVGQRVTPDGFDPEWTNECAAGVHFLISKIEAENY